MVRDRSIAVHSKDIREQNLDDPKLKQAAFSHYHEMCRLCHGAPEYPPEEFAKDLYAAPPSMTSGTIQKARSNAEIYWIVRHGLKMTAMPAYGPTHEEADLWGLVALAQEMSQMTPERYRQLARARSRVAIFAIIFDVPMKGDPSPKTDSEQKGQHKCSAWR
jgi:mono/diheme cytochrome c family protein